jgi:hypothetical protein
MNYLPRNNINAPWKGGVKSLKPVSIRTDASAEVQTGPKELKLSYFKSSRSNKQTRQTITMVTYAIQPITAQAINGRLLAAVVQDQSQTSSYKICGGTGVRFLGKRQFPLPILIPPTASVLSSIISGWNNCPFAT